MTLEDHLGSNVKYLIMLYDAYQCHNYIEHRKNDRIVLLFANITGNEIEALIDRLRDLTQFHSAYILTTVNDAEKDYELFNSLPKVSKSSFPHDL